MPAFLSLLQKDLTVEIIAVLVHMDTFVTPLIFLTELCHLVSPESIAVTVALIDGSQSLRIEVYRITMLLMSLL